ncbi:hypothetical protein [Chryseobacterium sp. EO14]|uniref:hypothetical protein n=1 Tax=Chryseobacterium sp. EO14 TaxID=2950551 RepID=UPI002108ECE3|nr:hypothetical protein [Chryseobacterium sp. EO14]MCQ4142273.1 hypothetical protein [Chryseobacterium sp. EO14]
MVNITDIYSLLIEEVKKDVSKQFVEQVKTLSEQLTNKNKEFEKLQQDSVKQVNVIHENSQKQIKSQAEEFSKYKSEIALLQEKNLKAKIESETAKLSARIDIVNKENSRLKSELEKKKSNLVVYIILLVVGILIGFILTKT